MTKTELIKALEVFKDDDIIVIWEWSGSRSKFYEVELTLQNDARKSENIIHSGDNKGKHFMAITKNKLMPLVD